MPARNGRRNGGEAGGELEQALHRAGDGVFVVDGEGRIALWNRAAERILEYPAREVLGRPCCEVLGGRDEADNRLCYPGCHILSLVAMGDSVQSFDMRAQTRPGRSVWLSVSILVVSSGPRPHTVHIFRDVTATRELLTLVHRQQAGSNGGAPAAEETLTRRELGVLRLLAAGTSTRTAAEQLHVSRATVRNHVQNILRKLGAHSRLEAVARAHRLQLL